MDSFCAACGNSGIAGEKFCRVCGRPVAAGSTGVPAGGAAPPVVGVAQTSGKAVASLACGLLFFVPLAFVAAVVLGHLALSEIKKSAGRLTGEGLAIAGLVLGYMWIVSIPVILIVAAIAIPNLLRARIAANESSAVASVRALMTAEIRYVAGHPEAGFTCSLSDLSAARLISAPLASGQKTGYVFELQNCSGGPSGGANEKYQVMAHPLMRNQTGIRTFCSDESGVIKVIEAAGSAEACLEHGAPL
jgi:type IV pilus assembly protein PilA